jgi:hypothetical protein
LPIEARYPQSVRQNNRLRMISVSAERIPLSLLLQFAASGRGGGEP